MNVTVNFNTANPEDVKLLGALGIVFQSYNEILGEKMKVEENVTTADKENEEKAVSEEPVVEKPKRTRRKKVEEPVEEEPKFEETVKEATEEEPAEEYEQGELPFDTEVETPAEENNEEAKEEVKTLTVDEWVKILSDKRDELKLDGDNAPYKKAFNSYVMELSKPYGAEKPKLLTPENLYKFVNEAFKSISIDGEGKFYQMPF